ncbi:MAG: chlorophyll synthesis pathway protein BchC [Pseudomonadota bacterium]
MSELTAHAVVVEAPEHIQFRQLNLVPPGDADVVVNIDFSGISTGTERLIWNGTMPPFPSMGYPLVPGYESVGQIVAAGPDSERQPGQFVFVPGSRCFGDVRGLFGGAASRVVVPGNRTIPIDRGLESRGVLMALAATAYNAIRIPEGGFRIPDLIIGHGVLGRLLARLAMAMGDASPVVWEIDDVRRAGDFAYKITAAEDDERTDYHAIYDASGAGEALDDWIGRLAPAGEIVLAGMYHQRLSFDYSPAFMRRARFRVAAEWQPGDLDAVSQLVHSGRLSLDDLITDCKRPQDAQDAYVDALTNPANLKTILDWRDFH